MAEYTTKPAQFRLPQWAQEFIARETATRGVGKTEVVLDALRCLEQRRVEEELEEAYAQTAEFDLHEAREWDATLRDGLGDGEW